jgi:hypothetical protein
MKTDYRPFVVDEISCDVVAVLSVSLGKKIISGTTIAVMITIPAMIPIIIIIHIFLRPVIALLKNESVLCYLFN